MLLLSILNWLIFRAISRSRTLHASLISSNSHRRDFTMATVLTSIVVVFVVCHTPKAALNIYEVCMVRKTYLLLLDLNHISQALFSSSEKEDAHVRVFMDILANISHVLIVTNSSVNIIVYTLKVLILLVTLQKYIILKI